jgi:uncharacterized membrane protein
MRTLWLTVLFLLLSHSLQGQDARRDGNLWIAQTQAFKSAYVLGFFDGTNLGHEFSLWKYYLDKSEPACLTKNNESYKFYFEKYAKGVTSTQLVDGLDVFYKDYRNRKIEISSAVWLTLNAIAGTPQADLDKMVESFRQNAN